MSSMKAVRRFIGIRSGTSSPAGSLGDGTSAVSRCFVLPRNRTFRKRRVPAVLQRRQRPETGLRLPDHRADHSAGREDRAILPARPLRAGGVEPRAAHPARCAHLPAAKPPARGRQQRMREIPQRAQRLLYVPRFLQSQRRTEPVREPDLPVRVGGRADRAVFRGGALRVARRPRRGKMGGHLRPRTPVLRPAKGRPRPPPPRPAAGCHHQACAVAQGAGVRSAGRSRSKPGLKPST